MTDDRIRKKAEEEAMSDEREELAERLWEIHYPDLRWGNISHTTLRDDCRREATRLLPYIRERVEAAVLETRLKLSDAALASVRMQVDAAEQRDKLVMALRGLLLAVDRAGHFSSGLRLEALEQAERVLREVGE